MKAFTRFHRIPNFFFFYHNYLTFLVTILYLFVLQLFLFPVTVFSAENYIYIDKELKEYSPEELKALEEVVNVLTNCHKKLMELPNIKHIALQKPTDVLDPQVIKYIKEFLPEKESPFYKNKFLSPLIDHTMRTYCWERFNKPLSANLHLYMICQIETYMALNEGFFKTWTEDQILWHTWKSTGRSSSLVCNFKYR